MSGSFRIIALLTDFQKKRTSSSEELTPSTCAIFSNLRFGFVDHPKLPTKRC